MVKEYLRILLFYDDLLATADVDALLELRIENWELRINFAALQVVDAWRLILDGQDRLDAGRVSGVCDDQKAHVVIEEGR